MAKADLALKSIYEILGEDNELDIQKKSEK